MDEDARKYTEDMLNTCLTDMVELLHGKVKDGSITPSELSTLATIMKNNGVTAVCKKVPLLPELDKCIQLPFDPEGSE